MAAPVYELAELSEVVAASRLLDFGKKLQYLATFCNSVDKLDNKIKHLRGDSLVSAPSISYVCHQVDRRVNCNPSPRQTAFKHFKLSGTNKSKDKSFD